MAANFEGAFYIVIPGPVRLNPNLSVLAKYLYGEIAGKCNMKGYCWATNQFFVEIMSSNIRSIQRYIKELEDEKLIVIEIDRTKQGTERRIFLTPLVATDLSQGGHAAGDMGGHDMSGIHINNTGEQKDLFKSNDLNPLPGDKKGAEKKKAATKPAKSPAKKKAKTQDTGGGNLRYKKFIEIYDTWYKDYQGMPPQIDGVQGRCAKSLIGYLEKIVKSRAAAENKTYNQDEIDNLVLQSWTIILQNWGKLEPFYQDKTTIREINSNIQNIIKQIRHGKATAKPATGGQVSTASLSDAITKHYNGNGNQAGPNTAGNTQQ